MPGDERTATEAASSKPHPASRCGGRIWTVLWAVLAVALVAGPSCSSSKDGGRGAVGGAGGGIEGGDGSSPTSDGGPGGLEEPDGAVGSGGSQGSFSWSGQGQSFSNVGYYQVGATADAQSLTFTISSDYSQFTIPCWLKGQFGAVPPPAGMYPIVDAAGAQDDGTFIGGCSTTGREATIYADPSVSGMVTLTQSAVGLVEGSFMMRTRPNPSLVGAPGSMTDFTGMFSVGCLRPITDPSCTAQSVSPP